MCFLPALSFLSCYDAQEVAAVDTRRWIKHMQHYAEIYKKIKIECPKNNLAQQVGETYYQLSLLASVTSNQHLLPPPPLQYSGPV